VKLGNERIAMDPLGPRRTYFFYSVPSTSFSSKKAPFSTIPHWDVGINPASAAGKQFEDARSFPAKAG
jgi:hypothetical protein